jgi:endonuclease III
MPARPSLRDVVTRLSKHYGAPTKPRTTDPYEQVLLENVAYLVDDERRQQVWTALRQRVGMAPRAILGMSAAALADVIARGGMHAERRAGKVRACAELAQKIGLGVLRAAVRDEPDRARKLLKRFPGIGDPGADRILLFAGTRATLAPDSNALRALVRLGFADDNGSYAATYRRVADSVADQLPDDTAWLTRAHQLLRRHGQDLCKRSAPLCGDCPLSKHCPASSA